MHEFKYRHNRLYCEKVLVEDIALQCATPLYVYSLHTVIDHFTKLKKAFASLNPLICYSVKANSNLAILRALVCEGSGLDIVSGGELFRALKVGCPPERIVYASVGKTYAEIEEAITRGILFFNVESSAELEVINRCAGRLNKVASVALRINPDVEPKTHSYITTGKLTNKFGIDLATAQQILESTARFTRVRVKGLHIHIGSQITESSPFVAAITKVIRFIGQLKKVGVCIDYLNIGGGLGIIYNDEKPQSAIHFAKRIVPLLQKSKLKIIMEPGRFIVGNAGILVTRVLYVKNSPKKKFVIVDAGMNDLIRPALYGAYHAIVPLRVTRLQGHKVTRGQEKVDIVGPICESGDFLAKERMMPPLHQGDYLAVMSAGAYGFSMSSNYNSRRKAAEVLVHNDKVYVIRERDTYDDMVRNEGIPLFLSGVKK